MRVSSVSSSWNDSCSAVGVTVGKTSTSVTAPSTWGDRDMTARTAAEWSPMNSIPTVP